MILRFVRLFALFLACAGMCACAGVFSGKTENSVPAVNFLAYAKPAAGTPLVFKHQIDAVYNDGKDSGSYTGVVKWDDKALTLVATGTAGRLCKIVLHADGKIEKSTAAFLPEKVRENLLFALRDFQFIFYPAAAVGGKTFRVEETALPDGKRRIREIFENDELLLKITGVPADAPLEKQKIFVVCPKWHYEYTLTPLD